MRGAFWIIGIVLLIVFIIGVKVLTGGSSAAQTGGNSADITPPDMVVCWGNFDGEKGVAGLDPLQPGRVVFVAPENKEVQKGTVLLRIDDAVAQLKATAAKLALDEAKTLPALYEAQIAEAKSKLKTALRDAQRDLDRLKKGDASSAQIAEAQQQVDDQKTAGEARIKQIELQNAALKIAQAETQLKEAEAYLKYFQVIAPDDGTVLRVNVHDGETFAANAMRHAVEFLPKAPIIIKAEVMQEWGRYIKEGQSVIIEDDTYKGPVWEGSVKSVSEWYAQVRTAVIEPFRMNDVRTLECIISVKDAKGARIGQRVRAKIKIDMPAAAK